MKIVTWNVNSVRVRLPIVTSWLKQHQPDVVLLQELKCLPESFPAQEFEDLGYNLAIHSQKTYNGVAILAKSPIEDVICGLPTFSEDAQARYIEAVVGKVRVASVYVPNGQEVDSPAYAYKLEFLRKFHAHLNQLLTYDEACVLGGDYNIAPTDEDVYDPRVWTNRVLCSEQERKAFQALSHLGYQDAIRLYHQGVGPFTWWDYRAGSFAANKGLRIDHLLLSPTAADCLQDCQVDATPRAAERASDHAPVWCTLNV